MTAVPVFDDLGEALLAAARRLLESEGPGALSVRRIAAAAGTSTMGVYSRFGGKDGVIDALFVDAFKGLADAIVACQDPPPDDPTEAVLRGCRAYRRYALDNPSYYRIMFDRFVPDWTPSQDALDQSMEAFELLVAGLAAGIEAGAFIAVDPYVAAHSVWATCHGLVSLELQELGMADYDAAYELALRTIADGLAAR